MALPMIETGYKPEFGLGAMYQGFNAANADQGAELELIKQFLANQHAQVQNPLDEQTTAQNLLANHYKTDPRYQTGMTDMIEGQGYSNLAAGQTARGLQPFKQSAGQAELQTQESKDRLFGNMFRNVERQGDQNLPEKEREAAAQQGFFLADTLSEIDPKFMQQKKLLGMKTDSAMDLKELDLAGRQRIAGMKQAAVRGDKTAQEALVKYLQGQMSTGKITPDEYAAELAELQNAILAAKIQPGNDLDPNNPALKGLFQRKPAQSAYTAPVTGQAPPVQQESLQKHVEGSGIAYEPTKYDYRVVDGKVQRKAKGN